MISPHRVFITTYYYPVNRLTFPLPTCFMRVKRLTVLFSPFCQKICFENVSLGNGESMSDSENTDGLKRTKRDVGHTLAKAGLSAIPIVGGPIAELISLVWEPALSKRRDAWLKEIADNLESLTEKIDEFKIENLADNETFITTTIQASQAAIRNHQKEKLEALRNAVLNSALGIDLDDDLQLFFLSLIDNITVSHIQALKIIASTYFGIHSSASVDEYFNLNESVARSIRRHLVSDQPERSIFDIIRNPPTQEEVENVSNNYKQSIGFLSVVVEDLNNQGLIIIKQTEKPDKRRIEESQLWGEPNYDLKKIECDVEVTFLGRKFLQFIATPDHLDDAETSIPSHT